MATITDDALCIRHWDFSETSQTVLLLTRAHGLLRGLAKGAKREKGPFSGGIDLLARGQVVAIVKPERELATLTAWHLQEIFPPVRQRLEANRAGLYIADLLRLMLHAHDPHERLYDAALEALRALDSVDGTGLALLRFQWTLLVETGYQPQLQQDAATGVPFPSDAASLVFSPRAGGLIAPSAGDDEAPSGWRVRRETIDLLRRVAEGSSISRPAAQTVDRANRLLASYIRDVLGEEPPTVRWAFSDLALPRPAPRGAARRGD